ncbi:ECF transporter S component [Guggenheimella bovis]
MKRTMSTKMLALMGIFIALSAVGSYIKIPSPTGTVAFDSAPGFLGALIIGPIPGAIICFFGHMLTAGITGFPLTVPIHLFIAVGMGFCGYFFGLFGKKGKLGLILAIIIGLIINVFVTPLVVVPKAGWGLYVSMLLPLFVGAGLNILVAVLVFLAIKDRVTV